MSKDTTTGTGWTVEVTIIAPSSNEDYSSVLAHGLTEDEAYELVEELEEDSV